MNSTKIRQTFLDFFKSKNHHIIASAPMVVKNDPTLMFVNSGMAPFKANFMGNAKPVSHRVADTQKCLRVSGKHNDLEEVGYDTYHHTLFEMLGNWSFGDYFKKEAIEWAWELLTQVYKIDKSSLYVTVFEGCDIDNLSMDQEAYDYWKNHISENRILMGSKKDNFWEMGDQGPCGPCSEIHVDLRSPDEKQEIDGKTLVNKDHPQVVEIWNLVFMQYNRKANGNLENLSNKHIDTGMGFERLCMVLQGKKSNYDTDVFTPIIREIETITHTNYGVSEKTDVAIRVIADHVRAVAFSIADGQLPSHNGAGYVIRRILRRAVRYGFTFLNQKNAFIYRLVDVIIKKMGTTFPELISQKQLIENVIKEEEISFLRTLEQGLVLLDQMIEQCTSKEISGGKVFELKDTYGFPEDLTNLILKEKGYTYNLTEFNEKLEEQKGRGKSSSEMTSGDWKIIREDDVQEFVGYDYTKTKVKITKYRKVTSKKEGTRYQLVFNLTPFYAEGGGQVGDKGYLQSTNGDITYIIDTKKENDVIVHFAESLPNNLSDTFTATVDKKQRYRTECNHTATHLLHQALREVLGTHVEQKGSAVHSKYLRFDFSHFSKLTVEELRDVENFVNARIDSKLPFEEQRQVPMEDAEAQGAMALFGEKYGDTVRTVRFGQSIELCGGTHVKNTSDIWHFKIVSESAVASGIRRIEAITYDAVKDFYFENNRLFYEMKDLLNNAQEPVKALSNLQEENQNLKKEIELLKNEKAKGLKKDLKNEISQINGVNFLAKKVDLDTSKIKDLCFELGGELNDLFILMAAENNGKATLSCYISKNLVKEKNLNAGQIVRDLGKYIQGGGGGQAFFATAGGKHPEGITEALKAVKTYL